MTQQQEVLCPFLQTKKETKQTNYSLTSHLATEGSPHRLTALWNLMEIPLTPQRRIDQSTLSGFREIIEMKNIVTTQKNGLSSTVEMTEHRISEFERD